MTVPQRAIVVCTSSLRSGRRVTRSTARLDGPHGEVGVTLGAHMTRMKAACPPALTVGTAGENVAWAYLEPIEGRDDISGYLSFYRDRVDLAEVE